MSDLKIGDIVARKSYGCDIFFKVVDIKNDGDKNIATLKGISYRIEADAEDTDLEIQPAQKVDEYRSKSMQLAEASTEEKKTGEVYMPRRPMRRRVYSKKAPVRDTPKEEPSRFRMPGRILHLDGDEDYLETCLAEYRKLGMTVTGKFVREKDQPGSVCGLLEEHRPDVLVLTGHDGMIKSGDSYSNLSNYRNSQFFIEAVKEARKYNPDLDGLIIFAGACQSLYYEILKAGANYASAPGRALIHALDPVRVCQKVAFAGIHQVLTPEEVVGNTITGKEGIGGVQTRGKFREGYPQDLREGNIF